MPTSNCRSPFNGSFGEIPSIVCSWLHPFLLDTGLVPIKTWFNGKTTFSHKGSQGNVSKWLDAWQNLNGKPWFLHPKYGVLFNEFCPQSSGWFWTGSTGRSCWGPWKSWSRVVNWCKLHGFTRGKSPSSHGLWIFHEFIPVKPPCIDDFPINSNLKPSFPEGFFIATVATFDNTRGSEIHCSPCVRTSTSSVRCPCALPCVTLGRCGAWTRTAARRRSSLDQFLLQLKKRKTAGFRSEQI